LVEHPPLNILFRIIAGFLIGSWVHKYTNTHFKVLGKTKLIILRSTFGLSPLTILLLFSVLGGTDPSDIDTGTLAITSPELGLPTITSAITEGTTVFSGSYTTIVNKYQIVGQSSILYPQVRIGLLEYPANKQLFPSEDGICRIIPDHVIYRCLDASLFTATTIATVTPTVTETVTATVTATATSTSTAPSLSDNKCNYFKLLHSVGFAFSTYMFNGGCSTKIVNAYSHPVVFSLCKSSFEFSMQLFMGITSSVAISCWGTTPVYSTTGVGLGLASIFKAGGCAKIWPDMDNPFHKANRATCDSISSQIIGLAGNAFSSDLD